VAQGVAQPVMPVVLRAIICLFSLISFSVMASVNNRSSSAYNFQLACGIVIWIFRYSLSLPPLAPPPSLTPLLSGSQGQLGGGAPRVRPRTMDTEFRGINSGADISRFPLRPAFSSWESRSPISWAQACLVWATPRS